MLFNQNAIESGVSGYLIENSLRFRGSNNPELTRTPAVDGNQRKWTLSVWIKRSIGATFPILCENTSTTNNTQILIRSGDDFLFRSESGGTVNADVRSNMLFRDPNAWYHIVFSMDTTVGAGTVDRAKLYVNGVAQTITASNAVNLNASYFINRASPHSIGYDIQTGAYSDGYMAEMHFVDGQALLPTDFGETDSNTDVWKAKAYAGTYGTNGFYLDFSSPTGLGTDRSGNGNNWTQSNFGTSSSLSSYDSMIDSPSVTGGGVRPVGNYAILNPLDTLTTATLINANLAFTTATVGHNAIA